MLPSSVQPVTTLTALTLPIDWAMLGWPAEPKLGDVVCTTGDPRWAWSPVAPAFGIHTFDPPPGEPVAGFTVDHVVLLVPDLEPAIDTLARAEVAPRLRMRVRGRPAAFFRVGPVLEVIESPVRAASLYGIALTSEQPLEPLALAWRSRGLTVGDIKDAVQPGRRIMTIHGVDCGLAVMSPDVATERRE